MFYEGSLQDGISTAVGQQKLVFCFVTDGSDESQTWEHDFLQHSSLSELISNQAVSLRLVAGSEEAGYLAQIFPLPKTPTVVIIKNGELKEYVTPGTIREDFVRRIQNVFNVSPSTRASTSQAAQTPPPAPAANPAAAPTSPEPERSDNVRRILAERAARLQAQKEEAERKAKADREKAKEKAKAEAEAGADTDAAKAHAQAELVKKRRQQEQEERRRILKRIEDDKEERRMRAAEREKARVGSQSTGDVAAALASAPESKLPSTTRISEMTSLQVRLFDGSTLRSRFKTAASLRDVRRWVDENRTDGSSPYWFKQVLTPLPNKNIDETEEGSGLADLGLAPSSSLVLIPVQKYSTAYESRSEGIFSRLAAMILGFFTWLLSLIGLGARGEAQPATSSGSARQAPPDRSRVRGFQDADRRRDQQLYNGNSLNFEPRPDEDER